MKKIVIAGTGSGVGKTTITLGIMAALQQKGLSVQPFKVGPDYIDTAYQTKVTGRASRNLDSFLIQNDDVLNYLFEKEAEKADISIIEGVMGLYDGLGIDKDNCSTASVAKKIDAPVILVIDGKATSTSVAAIVKGFVEFDPDLNLAGVILNRIASDNHYGLVKASIERYTDIPVLGYLGKNAMVSLPSRQLGLVPEGEIDNLSAMITDLGQTLTQTIDLDKLIELATDDTYQGADQRRSKLQAYYKPVKQSTTVAYALDEAFHFYYQDNLELMAEKGVTLIPFSPMNDDVLPEADLYYIGGGYPEEFAEELAANQGIKSGLLAKSKAGVPIYAECGGLMYLGESLEVNEKSYEMVGVFKGISRMTSGLKRFGYCQAQATTATTLAPAKTVIYGHEFHHSIFETTETPIMTLEKWRDGEMIKTWQGGYLKNNTYASYLHVHFFQHPELLDWFLSRSRVER
ncbi:cobyrinate a,c-diamide synthase [Vagococcus intermedius]|uniref:Cobyrinate a,c-diamide synthase n=1 Tax=Vagococcus intermedius TaxID=2991418 RepID=A0AAF0CTP0_9ENTE|nr:cobyrinate a,c-diamide synthase [Vagococcus intermedius]WEG72743.1 cobyrinate a,c-diamide synthase [Vagococcus intermedius]WEG74829.1 cobyrinate a,c-diamide synthase [Vagococcus intermedius]